MFNNYNDGYAQLVNPVKDSIEETLHWLDLFHNAKGPYLEALQMYRTQDYQRCILDNIRLSFELLLKQLFNNEKSLENQLSEIGTLFKTKGGSVEYSNMAVKLIEYYCKYQNEHVKHNDKVNPEEIDLTIEFTSLLMRHLIKISQFVQDKKKEEVLVESSK